MRRTPAHVARVTRALCTFALALAMTTGSALAHGGHDHATVYGPPAPDWAFAGGTVEQQRAAADARDLHARQAFDAALQQAPAEQRGRCVETAEFEDVGEGCRTRDGLLRLELEDGESITTHGPDYAESGIDAVATDLPPRMMAAIRHASKADITCATAAERHTRLVYAIPADGEDRSAIIVPKLRQSAYEMSAVIDNESRSLSPTAGRHIKFLCDGNGDATVDVYRLPTTNASATSSGNDSTSFATVVSDVRRAAGVISGTGTSRFLVYYDAHLGAFSGIGQLYSDTSASSSNYNNTAAMVALQDNSSGAAAPSWSTLLHEATHNMGAVSDSAPDTSQNTHCIDGLDVMCYSDGGAGGTYTETTCLLTQYDCDHDSYFHPAPSSGYLTSNWNVAATTNLYLDAYTATADTTAPTAPTNLQATGGGTFVRLTWTASTDAGSGVSAYRVYRQNGASWEIVDDSWPGDTTLDATWTGITASTSYTFKVVAYDRRGNESSDAQITASSGTAGAITRTWGGTVDPATDVRITGNTSTSISLAWTPSTSGMAVYYKVKRIAPNGAWSYATMYATSYTFTGLSSGTLYTIEVTAIDQSGRESSVTSITGYTANGPDSTAPAAPTNVQVASSSGTSPTLTWTASAGASSYLVSLDNGDGTWTTLGSTTGTSLVVEGLQYGATRTLGVSALDNAANASTRTTVTFSPPAAPDTTAPTGPSLTTWSATMTTGTGGWSAGSDNVGITGYRIYLTKTADNVYQLVGTTAANATSFTATGLTPGTAYRMKVYAVDAAGNTGGGGSYFPITTNADSSAPSNVTGLTASGQTASSVNLAWNAATDNAGIASYEVYRQDAGPTWTLIATTTATSSSLTGLAASTSYTFGVRAVDVAGLRSALYASVTTSTTSSDAVAPSQPGSLVAGSVTGTGATLSWSASTDNVAVTGYRVYRTAPSASGTPVASPTGTSQSLTGLTPATSYTFTVRAVDAAGNESTAANVSFSTPDTIAPSAPGSLAATSVTETSLTLGWTAATDNVAVTGYRVSRTSPGSAVLTSTTGLSYGVTGLSPATSYTFTVTAIDAALNETTATLNVTTPDTTAPAAPASASAGTPTGTSIPISWDTSTDNVAVTSYRVYRTAPAPSGTLVATIAAPTTSTTITGLSSQTSYTFEVKARDAAGNESSAASVTAATLDVTAPTTPSGVTTSARTATTITLGWNASTDSAGGAVQYRVYRNDGGSWALLTTTSSTTWQASGLTSSTAYTYGVAAIDGSGNETTKASHATNTADVTAPTQPGVITPGTVTSTSIALGWGASSDDVSLAGYRVYRTAPTASGSPIASPTGASATITGLTSGVSYTFQVTAIDASGNESTARTITIATTDVVAPAQPGSFAGSALGQSSVRLTWNAATDNVGVTGYRVLKVVAGVSSQVATTTLTQYDVTGLAAATSHRFQVEAYDAAGNVSTRAQVDVTTPDTAAPSAPSGVAVSSVSDSAIALNWDASSDNVAVTGYRIYRTAPTASGTPIGTTGAGTLGYTATGLVADSDHTFEVAAIDAAGNESTRSSITGRTAATPDTTPPTDPGSPTVSNVTSTTATLSWTASTDAGGVASYGISRFDGSTWVSDGSTTSTTFDVTGLTAGTFYRFGVVATDAAGNGSTMRTFEFTTTALPDTTAPSSPSGALQLSATSTGTVGMSWGAASDNVGVASYRIYRSGTLVGSSSSTSATLVDQPVGQLVAYAVTAVDAAGNEGASLAGSVQVPSPLRAAPGAPAWVSAAVTQTSITVSWAAAADATSYTVRAIRLGVVVESRTLDVQQATFSGLLPRSTRTFEVIANGPGGSSAAASVVATTLPDRTRPTTPRLLRVIPRAGAKLTVSWGTSRDAFGIARYEIRLVSRGTRTRLVRLKPSVRAFTVTKLVKGKTYSVNVRAVDRNGNASAWSNVLRARAR